MSIDVNTVSSQGTHFLAAVELIKAAREEFDICSENWPYPTNYRYGFPKDKYYAEVWKDGMDWQSNYWVLESNNFETPKCIPLIIFDSSEARERFNEYDFQQLVLAMLHYRRDCVWIMQDDWGHYGDGVWPHVERFFPIHEERLKKWGCDQFVMEHASQDPVVFFANVKFIPDICLRPQHVYGDWTKMLRSIGAHPYYVSLNNTFMSPHNTIHTEGQATKLVEYIGFLCSKTGTSWYISLEAAEETRNLTSHSLDERAKVNLNLIIDAFTEEEKEARALATTTLLENVNVGKS